MRSCQLTQTRALCTAALRRQKRRSHTDSIALSMILSAMASISLRYSRMMLHAKWVDGALPLYANWESRRWVCLMKGTTISGGIAGLT